MWDFIRRITSTNKQNDNRELAANLNLFLHLTSSGSRIWVQDQIWAPWISFMEGDLVYPDWNAATRSDGIIHTVQNSQIYKHLICVLPTDRTQWAVVETVVQNVFEKRRIGFLLPVTHRFESGFLVTNQESANYFSELVRPYSRISLIQN